MVTDFQTGFSNLADDIANEVNGWSAGLRPVVTLNSNVNISSEGKIILNEKISITVEKVWEDTEAQKVHRPENIKIVVKAGETVVGQQTITTEENKTVTFEELPKYDSNGNAISYTIEEQEVTEGDLNFYVPSTRIDEETGKVVITNTFTLPEDTTNVTVTKIWEDANNVNGKRPESIIIKLLKGEQKIASQTVTGGITEDTWEHTFTKLAKYDENGNENIYTVDEEQVNENDLLYYTKTINQETKEITNTYIVNASIRKVIKDTSIGLEGATIVLIDEQGNETRGVTNKDGYVIFGNLEKGKTYTYKEVEAPKGYVLNEKVYTLTVNENGQITYGENGGIIENEKITANVEITKYEKGTEVPVEGAIIGLFNEEGNALIGADGEQLKARTDSLGKIRILNLGIGTYCYKEIEAPAGYVLNEETYTFTIGEDGSVTYGENEGIIYNNKKPIDPVDPPEEPDIPDKPDKPTEPDKLEEPDRPTQPDTPNEPQEPTTPNVPVNPVKPNTPNDYTGNLPKTGETITVLIIAVITLSGSGIILTYNYIKMKKENR